MTKNESLKDSWNAVCDEYLRAFCDKHEMSPEPFPWIGGSPGTVACVGDMFVGMEDLRYDIDNDIDEEKFCNWYWRSLDHKMLNLRYLNYRSYCKGAPEPFTDDELEEFRKRQKRIEGLKQELEDMVKESIERTKGDNYE